MYPRILFITINGWNNTTGTATIPSIIEGYPVECVANIFIRADIPNSPVCDRYFQISEKEVMKSILHKALKPGKKIIKNDETIVDNMSKERKSHAKYKTMRIPFILYIRDAIWKFGNWNNENLKAFIEDFNPDVIMFPAEGSISFLNLAQRIVKMTQKPYLMFFWDDNFTYKSHGFSFYRMRLRNKIAELVEKSASTFAITPKMCNECNQYFSVTPQMLTRPVVVTENRQAKAISKPIQILYTGSLYIDRGKTIKTLIRAIREVNTDYERFHLSIYTNSEVKASEKKEYNMAGVSQLHPGVSKEEVVALQAQADVLLFVEALRGKYRNAARLSFSTKLTDYFAAGKCILAIAPSDIAPTEYLVYRDAALVADSYEEIVLLLKKISENPEIIQEYGKKALDCGIQYHEKKKVLSTFVETVRNAVK